MAPAYNPLAVWTGRYATRVTRDGATWTEGPEIAVVTPRPGEKANAPYLTVGGQSIDSAEFTDGTIQWGGNRITFTQEGGEAGDNRLTGSLEGYWTGGINLDGRSLPGDSTPFEGIYQAYLWADNQWAPCGEFVYESGTVRVGRHTIENTHYDRSLLQWAGVENGIGNGFVRFFIDPTAQLPKFVGSLWNSGPRPEYPNMLGVHALRRSTPGTTGSRRRYWRSPGRLDNVGGDRKRRPQSRLSFSVVAMAACPLHEPRLQPPAENGLCHHGTKKPCQGQERGLRPTKQVTPATRNEAPQ